MNAFRQITFQTTPGFGNAERLDDGGDVPVRLRWRLHGQVQGVGMRPFIFRIAHQYGLSGWVRNDASGVIVEAQGSRRQVKSFAEAMVQQAPPLVQYQRITSTEISLHADAAAEAGFRIDRSEASGRRSLAITVDTATCENCLNEAFDPSDRRLDYGLINCTDCGPRYSIINDLPYDRPKTVMAAFEMCPRCRREYEAPEDRRFHAQPIACHACGPQVSLVDSRGRLISEAVESPYRRAAAMLAQGGVIAIKGLGGFHLAARADRFDVVARLRELKRRDRKPFALMCRDLEQANELVALSCAGQVALPSSARPILLAPRTAPPQLIASNVAPDGHRLGVMLPSTAIHHLLLAEPECPQPLVMTSANASDQPLIWDNDVLLAEIGPAMRECDGVLWHDRPIARGLDDSVFIDAGAAGPIPVRRARGYVPGAIALGGGRAVPPGWCAGAELKNTVALVREGEAVLSEHLGDLSEARTFDRFRFSLSELAELFKIEPRWIAHDLHPQYLSTGHARQLARERSLTLIGVQHHHAHAAAVMAEHDCHEPVLAVVCDGVGYGDDGTIWGGELLLADRRDFVRLARVRPLTLPGGDASARETIRCGMAMLAQAFGPDFEEHPVAVRLVPDRQQRRALSVMLLRGFGGVASSAVGRWFDGAAAILGLCPQNDFEARAGLCLEAAADEVGEAPTMPAEVAEEQAFTLRDDEQHRGLRQIDLAPLTRQLIEGQRAGCSAAMLAHWFHRQLAKAWVAAVAQAVDRTGVERVVLSGGVFCNELLGRQLEGGLTQRGLTVYRHERVPPNDGGLALGQAAVALARIDAGDVDLNGYVRRRGGGDGE